MRVGDKGGDGYAILFLQATDNGFCSQGNGKRSEKEKENERATPRKERQEAGSTT